MERESGVRVVQASDPRQAEQGPTYSQGISAESVGASAICMHLGVIPPGAAAEPHMHEHETAIYVVRGSAVMDHGERLEHRTWAETGDFVYIPAGVPHRPFNPSETEPVTYLVARTDPGEQESVVLLPHLAGVSRGDPSASPST